MARLLLDEQMPRRLKLVIPGHSVRTVRDMGWAALRNGVLLRWAELLFDVFVTMDRGIPFQQAIHSLDVGVLLIRAKSNNFQTLGKHAEQIGEAASRVRPGHVLELDLRPPPTEADDSPST